MTPMTEALINTELLTWARERVGFSVSDMAKKLNVSGKVVSAWESGSALPTVDQAREFATKTHIAFGYLYSDHAPELKMPVADFRSGWTSDRNREEEAILHNLVRLMTHKKEWFEEHLQRHGRVPAINAFQGKFKPNASYGTIASSITSFLKLGIEDQCDVRGDASEFWPKFRKAAIDADIWLMESSNLESGEQRTLSPKTCRGIALTSSGCPMIWINSAMEDAAKVFTLAHELAHIWIGCDNVSNRVEVIDLQSKSDDAESYGAQSDGVQAKNTKIEVENICHDVAAEILVPESILKSVWNDSSSLEKNVEALHGHFGAGRLVVARKCRDVGFIGEREYLQLIRTLNENARNRIGNSERKPSGSGRLSFANIVTRNGFNFAQAVANEFQLSNMLWRDMCMLLEADFSQEEYYEFSCEILGTEGDGSFGR